MSATTRNPSSPVPSPRGGGNRGDAFPDSEMLQNRSGRTWADPLLLWLARGAAMVVVLMLVALLAILLRAALPSVKEFGTKFFTTTEWRQNELEQPVRDAAGKLTRDEDGNTITRIIPPTFGALPVIYGTAVSSAIAILIAVPMSFGVALFLVRIAPKWLVPPVSFLVEFLAAIPSIAYGIFGLFVLSPFIQNDIQPSVAHYLKDIPGLSWMFYYKMSNGQYAEIPMAGRNMLCAGLILAIMIVPIITSISRDVLASIPRAQVEGTVALGATWWQSCIEMLKFGRSALFGAVILGLARAAGETMAVAMVIGNSNQISPSPFAPAQTMASLLANEFAETTNIQHRGALVQVALLLLFMSLIFNVVARYLVVGKESRSSMAH